MEKTIKSLRLAIIILCSIMLALVFAGTIMMFLDETYHYSSGYYSYYSGKYTGGYSYYEQNPEAGIMPLFGFLLALSGFICVLTSKKKPMVLIGTIVLQFVAEILLGVSIIFASGYNGFTGYYICNAGMGLNFVVLVLSVIVMVLSLRKPKENNNQITKAVPENASVQQDDNVTKFSELKKIKELYDMGAITDEEFTEMKKNILQ